MSSGTAATLHTPAAPLPDSSKLDELQATVRSLREEVELQNTKCSELAASLEEAWRQGAELQRQKEEAKAENDQLLQNYSRLQSSVSELQTRVQEQESKSMVKAQHDSEIHALKKALAGEMFSLLWYRLRFKLKFHASYDRISHFYSYGWGWIWNEYKSRCNLFIYFF